MGNGYSCKIHREQGGDNLVCEAGSIVQMDGTVTLHGGTIAGVVGDCYFVDSTDSDAADASGGGTSDAPFATLDYAVGQCTPDQGDVIFVRPGHTEDLGDGESIDFDTAGITVIGLGTGSLRPRIDFNHANAAVDIGANNVTLQNLTFRPSVATVAKGVDIESGKTGCVIKNCEFLPGEAGDGTDEFVLSIDLTSGNHDTKIVNNVFRTHASCNGCTHGVKITAAASRVIIKDNVFVGNYSTAAVADAAACTDLLIVDNVIKVKDGEPGIELQSTTTGVIGRNLIESTSISDPDTAIVAADCSWFENYVVTSDGTAAELIGTAAESDQAVGTEFAVTAAVTSSQIPNNTQTGGNITGASSGTLLLTDIIIETDGTGLAAPTNIEFSTDNAKGVTGAGGPCFVEAIGSFGANASVSKKDATSHTLPMTLEAGKKVFIHGDDAAGTGAGVANVTLLFTRLSSGATVAANDLAP